MRPQGRPLPEPLPPGPVGSGGQLLPRWLRVLPLVLFVVLAVLEPVTPTWAQLSTLLAALPPLAGLIYGPRRTALLGAGVVLVLVLPKTRAPHISSGDLAAVTAVAVFSVLVAWVRSRYTRNLVVFRSVAEAAQRAVLPPLPPRVGPVRCAGLYRPALRATLVGGDLYDVRAGPFGVRALVGDVRGHGLAAVGTVAAVLGAFREAVLDEPDLRRVAARLDRRLTVDAAAVGDTELFATALLLELALDDGEVRMVSLGHPPALLLRDGGLRELGVEPAPPLGAAGRTEFRVTATPLRAGDVVLGYTDGVIEARDARGAFYPFTERLAARLAERGVPAPEELVGSVWRDLVACVGVITDDVALLALRPESTSADTGGARAA
ncbi:PP2C family protein-serine/threonine phosphatase [Streptomyces sp. B6B3]|uniref:PP2C family protein-serine/threonine phosphatase n=1 Tax=Streptomyces sp. B6B3 TaxID=3153570 RepID=UPI00325EF9F2